MERHAVVALEQGQQGDMGITRDMRPETLRLWLPLV